MRADDVSRRKRSVLLRTWLASLVAVGCGSAGGATSSVETPPVDAGPGTDAASSDAKPDADSMAANDATVPGDAMVAADAAGDADSNALKPTIHGLIDMGKTDFDSSPDAGTTDDIAEVAPYAASFGGVVINLSWGMLQPTEGAPLSGGNLLDEELAQVRAYNLAHAAYPLAVKLRITGGLAAPDWAKLLGGDPLPLSITRPSGQVQAGTVGRWWSASYVSAWRAFQAQLAARYDGEPLVREVAVTSCAASTDEPFVPVEDATALSDLHAAGYDDAAQMACLSGALADYAAWTSTWVDFTFNDFSATDSAPSKSDPTFTTSVMQGCTTANHCILATHYLNNPLAFKDDGGQSSNLFVYQNMKDQASTSTTDFQTASPKLLDWCGALTNAFAYQGMSVEIWPDFGGFTTLSAAQVANFATILATGAPSDASLCPPAP